MDGFLNINKPSGWTSHDVVARLRTLLKIKKIGHTGTLDPGATGVLPVCVGKATKLARYLSDADKAYRAVLRLGETTDTQDADGRTLEVKGVEGVDDARILGVMESFQGEIEQVPPMYSAVKVGGRPLYKAARAGLEVERKPRKARIIEIRMIKREGPDISFLVACSKGTYIRTLCSDIGSQLGVGGHLKELVRVRSGPFLIEEALSLEAVEAGVRAGTAASLFIPISEIFKEFPGVRVNPEGARQVLNGAPIRPMGVEEWPKEFRTGQHVLVYNASGSLIALAEAVVSRKKAALEGREQVFKVEKVLV